MANARDRLTHLVELASQSAPEKSRALAIELCDLLLDWPEDYSRAMRAPFEALMEKVVRGLDGPTRRLLVARLAAGADTPVDLLNEFFFDVPSESKLVILARNADISSAEDDREPSVAAEQSLLAAIRTPGVTDFESSLAECLAVDGSTASHILSDDRALAVACKAARLSRATFSAIALVGSIDRGLESIRSRLESFEQVPEAGTARLLSYWRKRSERISPPEPETGKPDLGAYASA